MRKIYRDKNGLSDEWRFRSDWTFGTELLEYVNKTYGACKWAIDACAQTGPGAYTSHFRPWFGGKGFLCIRIVRNENSGTGWDFSPD